MAETSGEDVLIELTANVVSAYLSKNSVASAEIPGLIAQIYSTLKRLSGEAVGAATPLKPAVPIKRSVTAEYIVCLEDGLKFKSLKRHLRTRYGISPDQYREKWSLPSDYPMVAPNYAATRSQLAKQMGLGQQRRRRRERP
jgi:predicted transcriptional regulator